MSMPVNPIQLSIIVPVYNNPKDLRHCLEALIANCVPGAEIIVVDDGSTDGTPGVAAEMGVRVVRLLVNSGQSAARNQGVRHAQGDILFFVDSDVVVMPGAISRVKRFFEEHEDVAAVFGSYDASPRASGVVSQYRNLLHHFVHQQGDSEASTFWAGCGAVRRRAFEEVGGFDEKRFSGRIEDIELGYRLRRAGHRIFLDKGLQGTHLKKWTLRSMIHTDVTRRAIPWSRLILESQKAPNDLNLKSEQRLSVVLAALASIFLVLSLFRLEWLNASMGALAGVMVLNRNLYAFFLRQRGIFFAAACIPLHLLYYLYSGLSYLYARVEFQLKGTVVYPASKNRSI